MKRNLLLVIIFTLFFSQLMTFAQTLQKGVVKEYRQTNSKRPLSGVEVEITNAGSVVSDKKGDFLLEFRTFKPGQRVNVRRIEKNGYEIFNKEALEQWNINPDEPFTIVMVKSALFKEIRDNYNRVSSKSYAEQYEKEKAALDKERLEGRLSEEKHKTELARLSEWYDAQLENLDNYIDRFARIDLAELDKNELTIIELVKAGELDKAIEMYNESKLIDTFESETKENIRLAEGISALNELKDKKESSIQELWKKLKREMDVNILRGGKENYEKVCDILKRSAEADPNNLYIMAGCISYAAHINNIALQAYLCELSNIGNIEDDDYRMHFSLAYSNALLILGEYEKSIPYSECVLEIAAKHSNPSIKYKGLSSLMTAYEFTMQIDKQDGIFVELLKLFNDPEENTLSDRDRSTLANDIGAHYDRIGDYVNSNKYLLRSYEIFSEIYRADSSIDNLRKFVNTLVSLGTSYYKVGDADNSVKFLKEAISLIEGAGKIHDPSFIYEYYMALKQLGILYFEVGDYVNSEVLLVSSLDIVNSISSDLFIVEEKTDMYNNLGYLYFTTKQYEKSEVMYKSAIDICYGPYLENPSKYIFNIFRVQINLSSLYIAMESYENAMKYGKDAILNCELIYAVYPEFIADNYVLALNNVAQAALAIGEKDYACDILNKAFEIRPDNPVTLNLMNLLQ